MPPPSPERFLLVRAGARVCALPISAVVETMRPLPLAPIAGVPAFVRGVALVRGEPTPVVALAALLGDDDAAAPTRFVAVRTGSRRAALAVDGVVGVAALDGIEAPRMPLLAEACGGAVEALAARDAELVVFLRAARLVPDEVHRALEAQWGRA